MQQIAQMIEQQRQTTPIATPVENSTPVDNLVIPEAIPVEVPILFEN